MVTGCRCQPAAAYFPGIHAYPPITTQEALDYYRQPPAGKLALAPTKPMRTPRVVLACSLGVAELCLAIAANKNDVYEYTAKGNLGFLLQRGEKLRPDFSQHAHILNSICSFCLIL